MDSPNFIDYVKLFLRSGKGGAGSRHFRKEKHVPLGGPDGGDGGRGGHIIIRANSQLWTLIHLRYQKHVFAEDGGGGSGQKSSGKQGEDTILEVPLGTVVKNSETGKKVAEVLEDGQEVVLIEGGRGGLGNFHFRTSVNQAPEYAQPGEPCVEDWFTLELKVLADVGLVGFPNAGKLTLLSVVSAAKPKIANYAFTTLVPNLGVVSYRDNRSFVMADIPGIIEGAADGKGLGVRFLRHIERNSMLLFVISADTKNIKAEYDILVSELQKYNPELLDKKRLLAISKMDLIDDELKTMLTPDLPKDIPHIFISAVTQTNLDTLKDKIWENLQK